MWPFRRHHEPECPSQTNTLGADHSVRELCELTLGERGSAKSTRNERQALRIAQEQEYAFVAYDSDGHFDRRLSGRLCAAGLEHRVWYVRAADWERSLRWHSYRKPTEADPVKWAAANQLECERFRSPFFSMLREKDANVRPYTRKFIDLPFFIWSSNDPLPLIEDLPMILVPGSEEYERQMESARDGNAVRQLREAVLRAMRNPIQWEIETGASTRCLEILRSPVVYHRDGPDHTLRLLQSKAFILFDLSDVPREHKQFLTISHFNHVTAIMARHFEQTGVPLKTIFLFEDCGELDHAGNPQVITELQIGRKRGSVLWFTAQTPMDFEPEVFEQLLGLCQRRVYFRMASGIDRIAKDLTHPTFDPMAIHFTRTRQQRDGDDTVRFESESEFTDAKGKTHKGKTISERIVPRYREVSEEYFKTPAIQEQEWRSVIARLQIGECVVNDHDGVRKLTGEPLEEPWPFGQTDKLTEQAIARILARPEYDPAPRPAPRARRNPSVPTAEAEARSAADFWNGANGGN